MTRWGLVLTLLFGVALVFAVFLTNRYLAPEQTGMEEITTTINRDIPRDVGAAVIGIEEHRRSGPYLVDGSGQALYVFTGDQRALAEREAVSTCYGDCAKLWPPLISSEPPKASGQIDPALLSRTERRDGSMQVTYRGWPLYRREDPPARQRDIGEEIEAFDAAWLLARPS